MNTGIRTLFSSVSLLLALAGGVVPAASHAAGTGAQGGISLGSTRVIYNESAGGASVRVINTSASPFLIQSWVDSFRGQGGWEHAAPLPQGTFVVTPPLFRLDKGENSVLVRRAGGDLPADRESVFSLNVKAIPQTAKPDPKSNYIQFAFVNSIKLFWRPAGLAGNPAEAYRQLTFKRAGDRLEAVNPTPYHITVKTLKSGGASVTDPDNRMVPPEGTQSWPLPAGAGSQVTYTTITDFGGLTQPVTVALQ
ncbi:fimbrial biogenesis chaperone [Enterobacter vonholyi]